MSKPSITVDDLTRAELLALIKDSSTYIFHIKEHDMHMVRWWSLRKKAGVYFQKYQDMSNKSESEQDFMAAHRMFDRYLAAERKATSYFETNISR